MLCLFLGSFFLTSHLPLVNHRHYHLLCTSLKLGGNKSSIARCLDFEQIDRDVSRCTWHLLTGSQRLRNRQMKNKHKKKGNFIVSELGCILSDRVHCSSFLSIGSIKHSVTKCFSLYLSQTLLLNYINKPIKYCFILIM